MLLFASPPCSSCPIQPSGHQRQATSQLDQPYGYSHTLLQKIAVGASDQSPRPSSRAPGQRCSVVCSKRPPNSKREKSRPGPPTTDQDDPDLPGLPTRALPADWCRRTTRPRTVKEHVHTSSTLPLLPFCHSATTEYLHHPHYSHYLATLPAHQVPTTTTTTLLPYSRLFVSILFHFLSSCNFANPPSLLLPEK